MNVKKISWRSWVAGVVMELIICGITAFLMYQFAIGVIQAKQDGTNIHPLAWFCLVMGILIFAGLNALMIILIKKQRAKAY